MKQVLFLLILAQFSCQQNEVNTPEKEPSSTRLKSDSLFVLKIEENTISIEPPTNSVYSLPDSSYAFNQ